MERSAVARNSRARMSAVCVYCINGGAWENTAMSSDCINTTEYYLLHYGEWNWEEAVGEMFPKLTYCVSLGELSDAAAELIAVEYWINYSDQPGSWRTFKGFSPDDGTYEPFYALWQRQSLPDRLAAACSGAMVAFDEGNKSDNPDEGVRFMRKVIRAAYDVRGEQPPSAEEPDGISADDLRNLVYETAVHEGIMMANDENKVDRYHVVSERKYKGAGWADIARAELEKEVKDGKRKSFTPKDVDTRARKIQYQVEAHRKNLELGKDTNAGQ